MGQAKQKQRASAAFPEALIRRWEREDCVNFAVALARHTGWLLHVDWLTISDGSLPDYDDNSMPLVPLRVYVGNDGNEIYDVRGIRSIVEFNRTVSGPLARQRIGRLPERPPHAGIISRGYEESQFPDLALDVQPSPTGIAYALAMIKANPAFLARIPPRPTPTIPAKQAHHFSFGKCAIYAEALRQVLGLQPMAVAATKMRPETVLEHGATSGYAHTVALHPDGQAEDSWGKQSMETIMARYGIAEWTLVPGQHEEIIARFQANQAEDYAEAMQQALELVRASHP